MNSLVANRDAQPLEGGVGAAMEPAAVKAAGRPRLSLKKLAFVSAVVAVAAGATWYGHDWWTLGRFLRTTDDAYVGADVITIAPNVGGLVTSVPVNDNQVVHAGDLLVKIDDRDYRA
ncbi:MAG TPA: biotin/lipoyl-binding protein, partial [Polyangiaceae bacterium]|nr:biotin/lipoyl-binding protein [Polyangiaceae bacterium]